MRRIEGSSSRRSGTRSGDPVGLEFVNHSLLRGLDGQARGRCRASAGSYERRPAHSPAPAITTAKFCQPGGNYPKNQINKLLTDLLFAVHSMRFGVPLVTSP